jgi:hypothetical protein
MKSKKNTTPKPIPHFNPGDKVKFGDEVLTIRAVAEIEKDGDRWWVWYLVEEMDDTHYRCENLGTLVRKATKLDEVLK